MAVRRLTPRYGDATMLTLWYKIMHAMEENSNPIESYIQIHQT